MKDLNMDRSYLGEAGYIAVVYAVFGAVWTLFTDQTLMLFVHDAATLELRRVELGWVFVGLSAVLLYVLLRQARRRLRESDARKAEAEKLEAVGRLAGGIAHDFNNVLTVVQGMTELVRDGTAKGDIKRSLLDQALAMVRRAKDLVASLLAFLRRQAAAPIAMDLAQAVQASMPLLAKLVKPTVSMVMDLRPAYLLADPLQLDRVLMNLVVNADQAMPLGGQLELRSRAEGDWAVLSVVDNGAGMDASTQESVFKAGFSTKGALGSGLGLASVQGIVEAMGGHVDLTSAPGSGSSFVLSFPLLHRAGS